VPAWLAAVGGLTEGGLQEFSQQKIKFVLYQTVSISEDARVLDMACCWAKMLSLIKKGRFVCLKSRVWQTLGLRHGYEKIKTQDPRTYVTSPAGIEHYRCNET
jgi:hypothetical protein